MLLTLGLLDARPTDVATEQLSRKAPERTLRWRADDRSDYYVLQILRAGRLAHVSLPSEPVAAIPTVLPPGDYFWRVYAGYGRVDDNQRRGPISTGAFSVGRA
jgi:hypothetical protein